MAETISDGSTAELTDDFYHRFKEDIKLAEDIGLDSFSFSISWPRILPKGKISGGLNPIGVKSYNEVIDEILANGVADNGLLQLETALIDIARIIYHEGHLLYLLDAIMDGVNVKGYYVWAVLNNWEWNSGYTRRFGIVYVDYTTLRRHFKASALWFQKFLLPREHQAQ